MEPTLGAHDLLLIDRSVQTVKQDAIYAFAVDGELRIKRIQRLFDGSLVIKSDNPGYSARTLPQTSLG
jgi:phage repressor protein C with HTH and peptisase S24 domain